MLIQLPLISIGNKGLKICCGSISRTKDSVLSPKFGPKRKICLVQLELEIRKKDAMAGSTCGYLAPWMPTAIMLSRRADGMQT